MTERFAEISHRDEEVSERDHLPRAVSPRAGVPAAGQVHKPLSLAAVLHHVLQMESPTPVSIATHESRPTDEPALRHVNRVLCSALESCVHLDASRQQLQGSIATQRELEIVLEMLAARVELGQAAQFDHRQVTNRLRAAREMVTRAVDEWSRTGRRFTQRTRLLPVQLEAGLDALAPVLPDEMDRLAHACLDTCADVHFSLSQRANAWATQRTDPERGCEFGPEKFVEWLSSLEASRVQAAADFASAREAYLQAVLEFDREHAGLVRARSLRRTAETGFRLNTRSAPDFSDAILEESRRSHAVLARQAQRRATQYHLYALAGLLPRQFGLIEPAAGY